MLVKDLISVIVPVYNASKSLDSCISSVCSQSYKNFELILIDDGSTDNSLEICRKYQQTDNRITVVHQANAGVSAARNAGLALARGEYFCFVDSDDEIAPSMLEKLHKVAADSHSELCICGHKCCSGQRIKYFTSTNEEISGKREIAKFVAKHYLEWLVGVSWGKLYKNLQLPFSGFDPRISLGEDSKFNIEYLQCVNKIVVIDECLYCYNEAQGSLTKSYKTEYFEAICDLYSTTLRYFNSLSFDGCFDLKNVNYKLFSFSISFMYQEIMLGKTRREARSFISKVCNEKLVQAAVCDLPKVSFVRKLYVIEIKRKNVFLLWFMSYLASKLKALR